MGFVNLAVVRRIERASRGRESVTIAKSGGNRKFQSWPPATLRVALPHRGLADR